MKAFDWPQVRARLTVDGVIAVVDAAAVADGRFADDAEALAAQRAADPSLDHDNPLEEVYEDQLLCADLVVLNKTDLLSPRRRRARGDRGARRRRAAQRRSSRRRRAASTPTSRSGSKAGAEDDLAARPSHHDAEEEHDHDDFDTFVARRRPRSPTRQPTSSGSPKSRAATTCCA